MSLILNLETATKNCSVALAKDGELLSSTEESAERYTHAEKMHLFIEQTLEASGNKLSDIDAVAVSNGPGSYTGLRIGISAAKGLCFGLDIPLIALATTAILARSIANPQKDESIIPAIDARRNEAYIEVFTSEYMSTGPIKAVEFVSDTFSNLEGKLIVVGDAAEKIADLVQKEVVYKQCYPSARHMVKLSFEAFKNQAFVNVAYHEPFYLKDFVAGTPKKVF